MQKQASALFAALLAMPAIGQAQNLNISAILNAGMTARDSTFEGIAGLPVDGEHAASPQKGFWLNHTELAFSGAVDSHFYGKLTAVLAQHDGATEVELEEAFVQTLAMPAGFSIRAGRFLSNIGYLNSKHAHTDFYVERPLAYRGLIGSHYYDDGIRLNWLAPTDIYLEFGAEAFSGSTFPASSDQTVGSSVLYVKAGDDLSESLSWQAGLSWWKADNELGFASGHDHAEHDEEHPEEDHAEHEESLAHLLIEEVTYEGENFAAHGEKEYWIADFVLKWAPSGNYKYQSLTWQTEWIQQEIRGLLPHLHEEDQELEWESFAADQSGFYTSVVFQFNPNWSAGMRYSQIDVDDALADFTPKIYDYMVQYQFSHFSTVRLQLTQDQSMEHESDDVISLQYTMAIGDHGAHQF